MESIGYITLYLDKLAVQLNTVNCMIINDHKKPIKLNKHL